MIIGWAVLMIVIASVIAIIIDGEMHKKRRP